MTEHTPTPWFVSGVRFRMNGSEWHSINRYDEAKKQDENIACVGYDPRTGTGLPDAAFIVKAVNAHDELVKALNDIFDVGDGYGKHSAVKPAGTTGEGHAKCREIARAALNRLNHPVGQAGGQGERS